MRLVFSILVVTFIALSVVVSKCYSREPDEYKNWAQRDQGPIPTDAMSVRYQNLFGTLMKGDSQIYLKGCLLTGPRNLLCQNTKDNKIYKNMTITGFELRRQKVGPDPFAIVSSSRLYRYTELMYKYALFNSYYDNQNLVKLTMIRDVRADEAAKDVKFVTFHNKDNWDRKFVTLSGPNYRCGYYTYDKLPITETSPGSNEYYFEIDDPNHECPPSRIGNFIFASTTVDQPAVLVSIALNEATEQGNRFVFRPFESHVWMSWKPSP